MSKLNLEARMTIQTLAERQVAVREIARLLAVSEGTVRLTGPLLLVQA